MRLRVPPFPTRHDHHLSSGKLTDRRLGAYRSPLVVAFALALMATPVAAQYQPRFDVRIPMRDGVELSADIYLPQDQLPAPVILIRTPYMKNAESMDVTGMAAHYAGHGYAFVVQDVRGRGDSDGEFDFFFADAEDGFDTVEWLVRQPWSNGDLCTMGVSYLGTVQWLAAKERPEGLKCMVSTAPAGRYGFDELPHQGGAFMLQWALVWLNGTSGRIPQDAVLAGTDWDKVSTHRPLLTMDSVMGRPMKHYRDFLTHTTSGPYWDRIILDETDFRSLDLPVLHITGLFDGDQLGALYYWRNMREYSPARDQQYLVLGPWNHVQTFLGGASEIGEFTLSPEAVIDNRKLHVEFFDAYLKETGTFDYPPARVYLTGANEWREWDEYTPPEVSIQPLYLHSDGRANSRFGDGVLNWSAPAREPTDGFTYDPKHPVPSEPGASGDYAAIERRDDILVYSTEPLEQSVEIAGPVFLQLFAASDALDTDFTFLLLDVFPDGRSVALGPRGVGIIRARYREGYGREVLLTPGEVEEYRIELFDVAHSFLPGHRIRIEVSSSHAPMFNPNQNTGNPIATDMEWRVAQQTIYHDRARPSAVLMPVLRR